MSNPLRLLLLAFALVAFPQLAWAGSIVYEGFDYPAGQPLDQQNGGTGFRQAWQDTGATPYATTGDSLVANGNSRLRARRRLATNTPLLADGDSVYSSFRLTLVEGRRATLRFQLDGWRFGIVNDSFTLNGVGTTGSVTKGQEYLFVSRLLRVDGGPDELALWIDPGSENDTPLIQGTSDVLDDGVTGFSRLRLNGRIRRGAVRELYVDELNVGTTFSEVVPVPEPNACWLLGALGVAWIRRRRT